jgi:hypothetical protein
LRLPPGDLDFRHKLDILLAHAETGAIPRNGVLTPREPP